MTRSRRSASSGRPTSPIISTRAAPRTGSASRRSAAPRTTASSCPTPTSTRSSTTLPAPRSARPASAAWRFRWSCRSGAETADALREKLIPAIEGLRVGVSTDPDAHYGPVVNAAHKARIENYIQMCIDEGGELVVDGRGFSLQGHEEGFFIGPTLFDHVKPSFQSYQEEIFGPVLQIVRADNFEEAVALPSEPSVRQWRRHLHPQRPRGARVRCAGQRRHGRHQRADPGAGRLSHVRRLEALAASATSTSTAPRACASGPRPRPLRSAGPMAGRMAKTRSTSRRWAKFVDGLDNIWRRQMQGTDDGAAGWSCHSVWAAARSRMKPARTWQSTSMTRTPSDIEAVPADETADGTEDPADASAEAVNAN